MTTSRSGHRPKRTLAAAASLLALALITPAGRDAAAQSKEEIEKARALFSEGIALAAANNCAAAIGKYRAVAKVKMTAQVLFNIAECEERLGKLASALGSYRIASSLVVDGKPPEVASQVGDRITSIESRVPSIKVKSVDPAVKVEMDGEELGSIQLGVAIPVNPGAHTISGKIKETEVWRETVEIAEKEHKTVTVQASTEKFIPPPTATPSVTAVVPPPTASATANPPGSKVPGIVVGGLGIAALGAGIGLFVASRGNVDQLNTLCGGDTTCPPSAQPIADSGRTLTGVSEALFAVGVAGIGTGIVLLVLSGRGSEAPAPEAAAEPAKQSKRLPAPRSIGVGVGAKGTPAGVTVVGRF